MDVLCNTGMLLFVEQFLFLQVCQQPFRSIFNQVKDGFETIDTAIVGIRHGAAPFRIEIPEQLDFHHFLGGPRQ